MNTATQQTQPFEAEALRFWGNQAQLQRTAFDAVADYLTNVHNASLAPVQVPSGRRSH